MRSPLEQPQPTPSLPDIGLLLPLLSRTLAREGRFRWRLQGSSMTPTLSPGCEVEIVPLPDDVALGSLIVFPHQESLVVHRLVRKTGELWIVQGDNRRSPDPALRRHEALGLVVTAYQNESPVWPRPFSRLLGWGWVLRAWGLAALRRLYRRVNAFIR